ncbi:hypothetical protein V6N13_072004 [Hibiscus sabdariffa]
MLICSRSSRKTPSPRITKEPSFSLTQNHFFLILIMLLPCHPSSPSVLTLSPASRIPSVESIAFEQESMEIDGMDVKVNYNGKKACKKGMDINSKG